MLTAENAIKSLRDAGFSDEQVDDIVKALAGYYDFKGLVDRYIRDARFDDLTVFERKMLDKMYPVDVHREKAWMGEYDEVEVPDADSE